MAKQLYERFPVKRYFTDLAELLDQARPDVVHITTPAESHFDVARFCLEQGCHVYVEKPFTLYAEQAELLINLAERKARQTNRRTQRPIQPRRAADESSGSKWLLGRHSRAHGELLQLRPWRSKLRAGLAGRQKPLGTPIAGKTAAKCDQSRHRQNCGILDQRFASCNRPRLR